MKSIYIVGCMVEKRLLFAVAKRVVEDFSLEVRLSYMNSLPTGKDRLLSYFRRVYYPDMCRMLVLLPFEGYVVEDSLIFVGVDSKKGMREEVLFKEICDSVSAVLRFSLRRVL